MTVKELIECLLRLPKQDQEIVVQDVRCADSGMYETSEDPEVIEEFDTYIIKPKLGGQ